VGSVSARVPLDVDLEDKLLYGLTPTRLAYLVIGLLAAFSIWSTQWAPSPIRAACAVVIAAVGAAAAWGRWRGRAVDGWLIDFVIYVMATRRLQWTWRRFWKRS
jgi:PrgI family protein